MAEKSKRADSTKEVPSSMQDKEQTSLLDQLESGPWPSFVRDRRPAELTTSGLRTKNSVKNFHLKDLIDVPIFCLAAGSGIARMAVECAFHAGARTAAAPRGS